MSLQWGEAKDAWHVAKSACRDLSKQHELAGKRAKVLAGFPVAASRRVLQAAMALSWVALLRKQVIVFFLHCCAIAPTPSLSGSCRRRRRFPLLFAANHFDNEIDIGHVVRKGYLVDGVAAATDAS